MRNQKFIAKTATSTAKAEDGWRNVKADRMSPEVAEAFRLYWEAYDNLVRVVSDKVGHAVNINAKRWQLGFIKRETKTSATADYEI